MPYVGGIHINIPRREELRRMRRRCPTCAKRTHQVFEAFGYYGITITCCSCGDAWEDGDGGMVRSARPFERGWRARRIEDAERKWQEARTP